MAVTSVSASLVSSLTISSSSSFSSKTTLASSKLSFVSFPLSAPSNSSIDNAFWKIKPSLLSSSSSRVFAAPEVLDSQVTLDLPSETSDSGKYEVPSSETPSSSSLSIDSDADTMAPKQKIRIKLRSYFVPLIEDSCKQIMDAAKNTNAKTMGPVPLPTKKRIYCVLKSPHVHKDARFHFEIRTHQRLIDILYPTAQTIDSLMQLDLPAGVDVEVKL
ncbi:30S ribosomal protein S10, chloroplastic [Linum perenne]